MNRKNVPKILNELAGVGPDAAATDRALDRAKSALISKPQRALRAQLMRPRNLAAIAAGIALIIVLSQLIPASSGPSFAFAQVQEKVAKARSAQYTVKVIERASKDALPQYETVGNTLILGDKKREELRVTSK